MPRFSIAKAGQPPRELTITGPLIGIGRDARNEICLTDPQHYVSRYHAVLVRMSGEPERYFIRDLSSVSGTQVNGTGAYQRVLGEGDSIRIAGYELAWALDATPAIQRSRLRVVASKSSSDAGAATAMGPRAGSRLRARNDADRDEILNEILLRTAHLHDAGSLLERLMPALVRVMSADRGFAGLFAGRSEEYEEVGATRMQAEDQIEIEDPNAIRALMEGKLVREETTLLTPIRRGQRTIGFFCLDRLRPAPAFTEEDAAFLTGLSRLVVPSSVATPATSAPEQPIVWPAIFVGRSRQIVPLLEASRDAAASGNVLILGENGSGKELIANTVHNFSRNRAGPFLARNCAALPETLAESELFGYAARSGIANADVHGAPGWFELADRGTLFLDEVHALSPAIQDKLLRVLEDREVWRIGARTPVKVDVVVISATDQDLAESVESGLFRRALYHRFARRLQVPPLRERKEDIRLLAHYFIDKFAAERGGKTRVISQRALEELMNYEWPGNVRELPNCISNCLGHAGEILFSWDLPAEVRAPRSGPAKPAGKIVPMEEVEREKIIEALRSTRGNISRASQLLGYKSRQTMLNKMDHYGIPRDYGDTSATG